MPLLRLTSSLVAGFFVFTLTACSNDSPPPPPAAPTDSFAVSDASPQIDSPRVHLETSESTTYYQVEGTTTEEIFASIEANGPTDNVGQQGSGLTSVDWEYTWSGDVSSSGQCSIRELTITADIVVELPQHADEANLPEPILANWQRYAAGVATHEQTHVDIYLEGAKDIHAAMDQIGAASNCEVLETQIDDVWNSQQARINGLQETFHADEDARLAASRGPIEEQINANRDQLASIQSQINSYDQQINTLRAEIAVFDTEVANIDAQIKQINEQFPDELPDMVRTRLEQLIDQSNDLLVVYNRKVDEHNGAIFARNDLSDQYDSLLVETNALVDQFNWTR